MATFLETSAEGALSRRSFLVHEFCNVFMSNRRTHWSMKQEVCVCVRERERGGGGGVSENSNSKTLIFLKDSSVRSIWTYLTDREKDRDRDTDRQRQT